MPCDHVIGSLGARLVRNSEWCETLGLFAQGVHFYHSTGHSLPHPGYMVPHAHCVDCGAKLNLGAAKASLSEALSIAIDGVLGTTEELPMRSALTVPGYISWLDKMSHPAGVPVPQPLALPRS